MKRILLIATSALLTCSLLAIGCGDDDEEAASACDELLDVTQGAIDKVCKDYPDCIICSAESSTDAQTDDQQQTEEANMPAPVMDELPSDDDEDEVDWGSPPPSPAPAAPATPPAAPPPDDVSDDESEVVMLGDRLRLQSVEREPLRLQSVEREPVSL